MPKNNSRKFREFNDDTMAKEPSDIRAREKRSDRRHANKVLSRIRSLSDVVDDDSLDELTEGEE